MSKTKILAIDPGTKEMGVALMEDKKLIYHSVEVIKKKKFPQPWNLKRGKKNHPSPDQWLKTKYPELKVFLTQDRLWKKRYHQNMFDAIGLAEMVVHLQGGGSKMLLKAIF